MPNVNLDALIRREDFEVVTSGEQMPKKQALQISDLQDDSFFFPSLRKPDFQRETAEWNPDRVVGLIRSFMEGELIPAVILWQNRELNFVIDGSHRLSALLAWVHDDFGDGPSSQEFFGYEVPDEQIVVAKRTRALVEKAFGSYASHKDAAKNPDKYGPDLVTRARKLSTLSLDLQWVTGNSEKAEESFFRINQRAAIISPQELELLKTRRKPMTIAARAIIRRGTGHKYWDLFDSARQQQIEELATDLHRMMFEPQLKSPIKSVDMPPGGSVYASPSLRMVYDFIEGCVGAPSPDDDETGERTVEYLNRCRRVMRLILSNYPSSLGLHPAVYFYSWTGKQQPILFITMANLVVEWERAGQLSKFIEVRGKFEDFLIEHRALSNQIIRKFGTSVPAKHLRDYYETLIRLIGKGLPTESIIPELQKHFAYLQPAESPYEGVTPTKFSTQVKSGLAVREFLASAPRCPICKGVVPMQAISIDHIERKEDGGHPIVDNAQVTHPYCNTGYKESQVAKAKGLA